MKRLALIALIALALVSSSEAAKNTCIVTPSPVPEGSDFTITASGLRPLTQYWIRLSSTGDHYGHHPDDIETADALGNFLYSANTYNPPRDSLYAGDSVSVRIYPHEGGGTTSSCKFMVTS